MPRSRLSAPLELVACAAVFTGFAFLAGGDAAEGFPWSAIILGFGFWWGSQQTEQAWILGSGLTLLVEFVLVYRGLPALPLWTIVVGCACCGTMLALLRTAGTPSGSTLLVVDGPLPQDVIRALQPRLQGLLAPDPALAPEAGMFLGVPQALPALLAPDGLPSVGRINHLVLAVQDWRQYIMPCQLLEWKCAGGVVELQEDIYRRLLHRTQVELFQKRGFINPHVMQGNRRAMAVQAVYSNLLGLLLLAIFLPVLIVFGVLSKLAAGGGTLFMQEEYAGFQRIPFMRRRFWTHHTRTGKLTKVGSLLEACQLTNLPQLVNVVRGEMAICGPQPVRVEFAAYVEQLWPVYGYRFVMKPGLFGWAQLHRASGVEEECQLLEYDLFYLEGGSIFMDMEILRRSLLRF